ncbi:hypothetical protein [uncultured Microbacterium sp.]|uniref:hypothetical protein n=1 Tax=uncultured Microbacterium sp. TaxID=191216 RepID=UPI0025CC9946|nr:hypothetical protein [uncultured Microbacterium sp.]
MRAVARIALTLWIRDVARVLGTRTRIVALGAIVSFVLLLLFGVGLALVAGAQLRAEISSELRLSLVRTSFAAAGMTAGLIAVVLCLSAPPRTALQNLLDLLPVSRARARLGQLAPVMGAGFVYSAALTSTAVVVILKTAPGRGDVLRGLTCYVLLLVCFLWAAIAAFTALHAAAIALLRVPGPYASAFAGVLSLAGVLALTTRDILAVRPTASDAAGLWEILPPRVFARAAAVPQVWSCAASAFWVVAALALLWLVSRHHVPGAPRAAIRLLTGTRPPRRTAWWGQFWAEILIGARTPAFVVTVLLLPAGIAAVWVLAHAVPGAALIVPTLAGSLPVLPFLLALHAVGRTIRSRWVTRLAAGEHAPLLWPQALAAAILGAALGAPALVAVTIGGLVPSAQVPDIAVRCLLGLTAALLCGAIVPYSEEQPLSATAAGLLLALVYMSTTLVAGWIAAVTAPGTDRALLLAAVTVFSGLYVLVASRQRFVEPVRV